MLPQLDLNSALPVGLYNLFLFFIVYMLIAFILVPKIEHYLSVEQAEKSKQEHTLDTLQNILQEKQFSAQSLLAEIHYSALHKKWEKQLKEARQEKKIILKLEMQSYPPEYLEL